MLQLLSNPLCSCVQHLIKHFACSSVMHSNTTATVALTRRRLYMPGSDQFLNIPKVFAFFRAPARWEMLRTHDNWERLVAAVLRSDELWELSHAHSRSPNVLSDASDHNSSFLVKSPESSSSYQNQPESDVAKLRNPDLVFIDGVWSDFGLEDLLRASAEVLGIGTFGRVYATKLDNRMTVVVKRLKLFGITDKDFKRSMEAVGNVRHPNVAALRAYFTSTEEKLLLYDHHSRGSVSDLLHGEPDFHHPPVYWGTRLRIALGAARGISRIHTQNGGKLVHGNIKASNIFLNSEGYGFVSDLGLANMIPTTFMPTARCYAPEVKSTQNVSQASDVYSFGILLLELLARKSPVQSPSGQEAVDLVNFVNSVKRKELNSKVFNGDLLLDPATREQAVSMFKVGLICVAKSPKKRPTMSAVVKMIEDIHMPSTGNLYFIYEYRSDTNKLVFFGLGKHTFDQTDLLRGSADVLGIGTFGASYKLMKMES